LEIANAALDAAFGGLSAAAANAGTLQQQPQLNGGYATDVGGTVPPPFSSTASASPFPSTSRILVLHNMVTEEDLATDEDYQALTQEVREECSKYGTLVNMIIPRPGDSTYSLTAVGKIFLQYALVSDALQAQGELQGRQFGSSIVEVSNIYMTTMMMMIYQLL
jgi:hypothetical protein